MPRAAASGEVRWPGRVLTDRGPQLSTAHEVAEAVAGRLRELGHETDVRPAAEVGTLAPYRAVVLGGALYAGRWHRDARRFLARHRDELTRIPAAIFAMGPLSLEPKEIAGSRRQLDHALAKEPELEPVSVTVFGGMIDPAMLRFPFNRIEGGDARDWEAIRSWADEIADRFAVRAAA